MALSPRTSVTLSVSGPRRDELTSALSTPAAVAALRGLFRDFTPSLFETGLAGTAHPPQSSATGEPASTPRSVASQQSLTASSWELLEPDQVRGVLSELSLAASERRETPLPPSQFRQRSLAIAWYLGRFDFGCASSAQSGHREYQVRSPDSWSGPKAYYAVAFSLLRPEPCYTPSYVTYTSLVFDDGDFHPLSVSRGLPGLPELLAYQAGFTSASPRPVRWTRTEAR